MNSNPIIILFGASGHLSTHKVIPALYTLFHTDPVFNPRIIGVAHESLTVEQWLASIRALCVPWSDTTWQRLVAACTYVPLSFTTPGDFKLLLERVVELERLHAMAGNRLLYCATSTDYFCTITQRALEVGIIKRMAAVDAYPWYRIAYEKPFGTDKASAHILNTCIKAGMEEYQVYRLDHYLLKELVANIALVRFTNVLFEPLWHAQYIDSVQIYLNESISIENRGNYYDAVGVIKDVVQNHMMQLLALVAMETPRALSGDSINDAKAAVLQHTRITNALVGQYEGYCREQGVAPDSRTPTFAALRLLIDTPGWRTVPFYFKTGKCLNAKQTTIYVLFKPVTCLLTRQCPPTPNALIIRIYPDEGFVIEMNAKTPGMSDAITPITMDFCHPCVFGPDSSRGYEHLLRALMQGDQSIAVRFDEIEHAWQIVDAIKWHALPLHYYQPGSLGPAALQTFAQQFHMRWRA